MEREIKLKNKNLNQVTKRVALADENIIPYGVLYNLYIEKGMSQTEISELLKTSRYFIRMNLIKYKIPIRNSREVQMVLSPARDLSKNLLEELYIEKQMSQSEIGDLLGISQSAVKERMKQYNIKARGKGNLGNKNGMYGRTHTDVAKQKIREANIRQFSDLQNREKHAILTCEQIQKGKTGKAYNKLEERVSQILTIDLEIQYKQQFRLGRCLFDFILLDYNVLIEAHGTFWHADPRFYRDRLSLIQKNNLINDAKKAKLAKLNNYKLVVVWEYDVYNNANYVISLIRSAIK